MKIGTADTTVTDFNIDISLLPRFGGIRLPFHVAIGRVFVKAAPAFELGFAGHVKRLRIIVDDAALVRSDGDGRIGSDRVRDARGYTVLKAVESFDFQSTSTLAVSET